VNQSNSHSNGTKDGPIPCQKRDGWCDYCELAPIPGLCHQPGPLEWTPEEAMHAAGMDSE
jgi:hypothetical protein